MIHAYERQRGEIVAYIWGKWNLETAKKLKTRLKELSVNYDTISTDN
ncbi:MAG: hypothetical protein LBR26_06090 [Prevotella sp.]|nr:hypothetical protein [Prevotella sp.]